MKISNEYPVMIFRKEYNDKTFYSMGLSRKKQDGTYENAYIDVRFKGEVNIPNQTNIYVKNGFMSFYIKDGKPVYYLVITEYQLVADVIKSFEKDEVVLSQEDLPF